MTTEELAAQKAAEEAAAKKVADDAKAAEEAKLAEIMKDPEAVKALLEAKRAANEEAKKLRLAAEEREKAEKAKQDAALVEQGKFKELLEKEKSEKETIKQASTKRLVDMHLKAEAQAAGALDDDAVVALASRAEIKVGEDFEVQGAKETVEALKKSKPHLFGSKDQKVAPPDSGLPAPRAGFTIDADVSKASARSLIEKGLEKK